MKPILALKTVLLFACVTVLLTTSGCIVAGRGHGHGEVHGSAAVVVPVPVVVVRPPIVIVH